MNNRKVQSEKCYYSLSPLKRVVTLLVISLAPSTGCIAQQITPGLYQVETRTVLPHLEEMRRTVTTENICLEENNIERLFPILKQPGMVDCRFSRSATQRNTLSYSLNCPGENGAEGEAVVDVQGNVIDAELNAKLGGKNMTFSQFADATLLG